MFTWYAWRAGSPACSSCSRKTGNSPYGEQEGEEFLLTGTIIQKKKEIPDPACPAVPAVPGVPPGPTGPCAPACPACPS